MRARFHPEAREDFHRAALRYANVRRELGLAFYQHVDELIVEIERDPMLFRLYRRPGFRRHFRRPFPYAVVYVVQPEHIWILAVMHFKQPPDYWRYRLNK